MNPDLLAKKVKTIKTTRLHWVKLWSKTETQMNNIIPKHDIPKHEVAVNVTSEGENEARGSTELVAPVFFGPTSDNINQTSDKINHNIKQTSDKINHNNNQTSDNINDDIIILNQPLIRW